MNEASQTSSTAKDEQALVELSSQKWNWMMERDLDALDRLFHEKSVFVHMGATMSKSEELEALRSGMIQPKRADIESVSVRFIGGAGIVLTKMRLVAVVHGNEVTNPFVVTEVYVQEEGRWMLGSLSFTRLLEP
ncbi:MAG TPA: nuclear transport factor 2 family protein [Allosphingosinicella sp.]|jgi:hypothetical protein